MYGYSLQAVMIDNMMMMIDNNWFLACHQKTVANGESEIMPT